MRFIIKLQLAFFSILIILISLSYHPDVVSNASGSGVQSGTSISPFIFLVFGLLLILSFRFDKLRFAPVIRGYILLSFVFLLSLLVGYSLGYNIELVDEIRLLMIPLIAMLIGWHIKLDDLQLVLVAKLFIICTLIIDLIQIFTNIGGFVIEAQYAIDIKNILGVNTATAAILVVLLFFKKGNTNLWKYLYAIVFLLLFLSLLTIRARTATLITLAVVFFICFKKFNNPKKIILYIIVGCFLSLIIFTMLPEFVSQYLYDSFFLNTGDDLTSDRTERNTKAIEFISNHLLIGNTDNSSEDFGWIHNYFLLQLFNYGFVFGFFAIFLYIYLGAFLTKNTIKADIFELRNFGYVIMLIPFGISLAEPTLPYGPGTATIFNFILFGISLKYNFSNTEYPKVNKHKLL